MATMEVFTPQKSANTTNQGSSPQPVVKLSPTYHWLYSLTEDHSFHQEPYTAAALSGFRNLLLPLFPSGLGEAVASQDASTSLLGCLNPCPHFINSHFIKLQPTTTVQRTVFCCGPNLVSFLVVLLKLEHSVIAKGGNQFRKRNKSIIVLPQNRTSHINRTAF